jgi:hypothetical protein
LVEFSSLVKFSEITANLTCTTILRREWKWLWWR